MTKIKSKKIKRSSKKKILIVEDEKSMQRALEIKFLSIGFDITTANNGAIALSEMLKTTFDIVLLDLIMPVADGFEVLEELQKRGDRTPVIVSTNLSQENDMKRVSDFGVVGYFVKSDTSMSEVVDKVKKVIGILHTSKGGQEE